MIANHPEVWQRICRHAGGRLVMLGTPNSGSHEIVRLLVGQAETLRYLSLLDITTSEKELLEIISQYPGVLEMLPEEPGNDFFSAVFWNGLKAVDKSGDWVLPEQNRLQEAAKCRHTIAASVVDTERILYIAGWAPATPCGIRIIGEDKGKKEVEFLATARGDGQVLWDTGIPAGVKTWYMEEVEHGDLANHEPAFPALLELLQSGQTNRLSITPPAAARGAAEPFRLPSTPVPMVPDERPTAAAIGSRRHGSLEIGPRSKSDHPRQSWTAVMPGRGTLRRDTIVGAEKYLDGILKGRLSDHQRFNLYPGPLGSNAVFVNPDRYAKPGGAIIVGLGRVGELSPAALTASFARALSAFVLEIAESPDERFSAPRVPRSARITRCSSAPELGFSVENR
jgi:hypothetical protein